MKRVILFIVFAATLPAPAEKLPPEAILSAAAERPIPVLSKRGHVLTLEDAYRVQRRFVNARIAGGERVAGFKAALTSEGSRKRFQLATSLSGVLLRSARLEPGARVAPGPAEMLMLETEIGYVFGKTITNRVSDNAAIRAAVARIVPAIEIPNLGFEDMAALQGPDIVAANAAMHRFFVGPGSRAADVDPNAVTVSLTKDEDVVNTGRGTDSMGNQWSALRWLVNTVVEQGWTIEPGHVLITGAMGRMIPAAPGQYRADFGELGVIEFEVAGPSEESSVPEPHQGPAPH